MVEGHLSSSHRIASFAAVFQLLKTHQKGGGDDADHSTSMVHPSPSSNEEQHPPPHPPSGKVPRTGFRVTQLVGDSCSSSPSSSSSSSSMLNPLDRRRTNDEIHKSIDLCPVMTAFIDTAVFQRLRSIKQLGTAQYVYMTANHSRFEHSLGVAHLAEKLCRKIMERQPVLQCTEKDVLCVKLAGLFHDLGHGPFSHVYEKFVKDSLPNYLNANPERRRVYQQNFPHLEKYWKLNNLASSAPSDADDGEDRAEDAAFPNLPKSWEHEIVSLKMIDLLLQELGLQINTDKLDEPLEQIGDGVDRMAIRVYGVSAGTSDQQQAVLTSRDFIFIKECIYGGRPLPSGSHNKNDELLGRPKRYQEWMYDIVSNRRSGLDVDKVDYFSRDECRAKGEAGRIDLLMIENAIVARGKCTEPTKCKRCCQQQSNKHTKNSSTSGVGDGDEHVMICYPEKMICATMDFFKKRSSLHTDIYCHKTAIAGTAMICDILCEADAFFNVPTEKGDCLPMSRAMLDATAMLNLKDSVIDLIKHQRNNPNLRPAQDLIRRFERHDFYKCAAQEKLDMSNRDHHRIWNLSADEIRSRILTASGNASHVVAKHDFFIEKCTIHHGQKSENPLSRMRFVEKCNEANKKQRSADAMNSAENLSSESEKQRAIFESLPRGVQVDEVEYDDHIPRVFQKNQILAFSVTKDKRSVVKQVFDEWWNNIGVDEIQQAADLAARQQMLVDDASNDDHTSHNDNVEDGDQDGDAMPPMLLTQESDDENFEGSHVREQRHGWFARITPKKQH
jgi:deoxynucleoside triphosphate triphosphohydrolase SAMHD1